MCAKTGATSAQARPRKRGSPGGSSSGPVACDAEGCDADLSQKGVPIYNLKRRLCQEHMRAAAVRIRGDTELYRFCFQCARLEPLSKFSGVHRTCSERLQRRRTLKSGKFAQQHVPTAAERSAALAPEPAGSHAQQAPQQQLPAGSAGAPGADYLQLLDELLTAATEPAAAASSCPSCAHFNADAALDSALLEAVLDSALQEAAAQATAQAAPCAAMPLPVAALAAPHASSILTASSACSALTVCSSTPGAAAVSPMFALAPAPFSGCCTPAAAVPPQLPASAAPAPAFAQAAYAGPPMAAVAAPAQPAAAIHERTLLRLVALQRQCEAARSLLDATISVMAGRGAGAAPRLANTLSGCGSTAG